MVNQAPRLECVMENYFPYLAQKICCAYSKEPSQEDGSFEYPKHIFKLMGKKVISILGL